MPPDGVDCIAEADFSERPSIDGLCFSTIISNRQPILHQP